MEYPDPVEESETGNKTPAQLPNNLATATTSAPRSIRFSDISKIVFVCVSGILLLLILTRPAIAKHLALIKVSSLAIAGICAVLNQWKKRHDANGNLDEFGKCVALLMILGAFTAVGAAYIEESNKAAANLAAKKSMEGQLAKMQEVLQSVEQQQQQGRQSLGYIERIVAPLTAPRVYAQFEILLQNPEMASLKSGLEQRFPNLPRIDRSTRTPQTETNQEHLPPLTDPPPDYPPGGQGITVRVQIGKITFSDSPPPRDMVYTIPVGNPEIRDPITRVSCLSTSLPSLKIELYSKHSGWARPSSTVQFVPDVSVIAEPFKGPFPLRYQPSSEKAYLPVSMQSKNWEVHPWLSSAPDLADADCCVTVTGLPPSTTQSLKPTTLRLDFGNAAVTLTNFDSYIDQDGTTSYHAKLPNADGIRLLPNLDAKTMFGQPAH